MCTFSMCIHYLEEKSMSDDMFNEHAVYFLVTEIINTKTIIIEEANHTLVQL